MTLQARFQLTRGDFTLDVQLSLPAQGVTALFGPSGSGKTTLLRCLAGLERVPGGRMQLGDRVWQQDGLFLPPHRRELGYVFQEASLFPHLSVRDNLEYGLKRVPAAERRVGLERAIELFRLEPLLERRPVGLSGGERQRVAIARALTASPRLLLMDEPLASLDHEHRREILPFLESLHRELEIPLVYVSHSPEEVTRLADRLVLLSAGRVLATGPIGEMLVRLDLPLGENEQAESLVRAVVRERDAAHELCRLEFAGGALWVPDHALATGQEVRVRIRAADVSLTLSHARDTSILNILPARVEELGEPHGARRMVRLSVGGTPLLALLTRRSCEQLGLAPGLAVFAQVKSAVLLS
ncbi:MAG: molybdenum ABC transporter ATP-binding protein [Candidatus Cloacimonetes bacterium]|nr:molybdenum ABC transporter ATP-binding protein [Candidatus Cloacimonadota bacterium]